MNAHLVITLATLVAQLDVGQLSEGMQQAESAAKQANELLRESKKQDAQQLLQKSLAQCDDDLACEARLHSSLGDLHRASPGGRSLAAAEYRQALKLQAVIKDNAETALERGDAPEALQLYQDALRIDEVVGGRTEPQKRLVVANGLTEVGKAYHAAGDTDKSLSIYEQVLTQHRTDKNLRAQAKTLELMSESWAAQGEREKALSAAEEAVKLEGKLKNAQGQARAMANLGQVHLTLGAAETAEENYQQAIQALGTSGNSELLAKSLVGHGTALSQLHRHDEAIADYQKAVSFFRDRNDVANEAQALALVGKTYGDKGALNKAREQLTLAAAAQRVAGSVPGEVATYTWMADILARSGEGSESARDASARASAWLLKQACALYEKGDPRSVGHQVNADYRFDPLTTYRNAARLLLEQGRIPEAVELLSSLKEQEVRRVRRTSGTPPMVAAIPFTEAERVVGLQWNLEFGALVKARASFDRLNQKTFRTSAEKNELAKLQQQVTTETANFEKFLSQLASTYFSGIAAQQSVADAKNFTAIRNALVLSKDVAAVYTVSFERQLFLILVTATGHTSRVVSINGATLPERVRAFRAAVQSPEFDATGPGKALYDVLVAPIAADLVAAGIQTIAWHLDGELRYVPLPALWDGQSWLVERYGTVVINPVSTWFLSRPRTPVWTITALGLSQARPPFQKLPGVLTELSAIIHDDQTGFGLLAGKKLLDGNFTRATLEAELMAGRPVVHIASHYEFSGAAELAKGSFLLLGDGSPLPLDEFEALASFDLSSVELLVLSACETALSTTPTTRASLAGTEVDGLAMVAHRKGAASILATLWRLSDASAPSLMTEFYRQRERKGASKAQALQKAQLAMLRGELSAMQPFGQGQDVCTGNCAADGGVRGVGLDEGLPETGDWRHPAYWAPFVLIGNWR